MYVAQGTVWERPQETHRWNNHHYRLDDYHINFDGSYYSVGDPRRRNAWWEPLTMHIPVLGGRRKYLVLARAEASNNGDEVWYVGWSWANRLGISRIPLASPVRVTVGPGPVEFLGFDTCGETVPITCIGNGLIGNASAEHAHYPLL